MESYAEKTKYIQNNSFPMQVNVNESLFAPQQYGVTAYFFYLTDSPI